MLVSVIKNIDKKYFNYRLSKCFKIAVANLYVRASSVLTRVPVTWIRSIDVEPVAKCNLECPFCQVPGWHRATETGTMGIDLFRKIIDQFPNLKHIKLQGMGEPFLNENLTAMIRIAGERNIKTTILTNGTLLDQSLSLDVLESKLTNLYFSFDAATKEIYEKLRVGASFETVVKNIKYICEMKKNGGYNTGIYIRCLVSNRFILDELTLLVELAADVGVDGLYIANRLKIWETRDSSTYPVKFVAIDSFDNYPVSMHKAERLANNLGVYLRIEQNNQHKHFYPCAAPWNTLFISVEGNVVPCCNIGSPDAWCMGNLLNNDINNIWNNESYIDLRKAIRLNEIPLFCTACYRKEP